MIRNALLVAASATALGLAACDDNGRARVDAPEPAPLAELTAGAADLPFAEPAPVEVYSQDRGYRWAERAYGLQRAVYDTPPDYGYYYDGIEPLVWETADDWSLYAEPWGGGYRYYYYEPGAAYPYFVRDQDYGYAYSATGVLIALFDSGGRYLPREVVYRYAPVAGRYYVRGRDLRNAGLQARRIQVTEQVWSVQEPRVMRGADRWLRAAREERAWRTWRERDSDRELARFEGETRRRIEVRQAQREAEDRRDLDAPERRDAQLDSRAERLEQRADRVEARRQAQRERAQFERRRQVVEAERQAQKAERQQAQRQQAELRRQAQAEQRQRAQAVQQQARAEQRRQAQQQAQAEQRRQQEAQVEQRRQQQAAQQQARRARQAEARSAEAQGQPAAARERGNGRDRDKDKKD